MRPIPNGGLYRFALYAVTLRSLLSMHILQRHYQRQTLLLPEEGS
jgi:hypothetical protein